MLPLVYLESSFASTWRTLQSSMSSPFPLHSSVVVVVVWEVWVLVTTMASSPSGPAQKPRFSGAAGSLTTMYRHVPWYVAEWSDSSQPQPIPKS